MKPAITVEHLSKMYYLGQRQQKRTQTLREAIMGSMLSSLARVAGFGSKFPKPKEEILWALNDVNLEIQQGEVVGILGRNGAGKSTLLKILSRITEPTSGRAVFRGRIGSLLEVGVGFHRELTGRENIYLNGAILGMNRREIDHKFDEIVAFSEIEQFLDTPIKHYSSGMYVRLAFAVAAHLDPEILIVDEVLAVGDASFQRKCLGTMEKVSRQGRTVLFVSHNMAAITNLCTTGVWLADGKIKAIGTASQIVRDYLLTTAQDALTGSQDLRNAQRGGGDRKVRFTGIDLRNPEGQVTGQFGVGEPIEITMALESDIAVQGVLGYTVKTMEGVSLFTSVSQDCGELLQVVPGPFQVTTRVDPNYLRPGRYIMQVGANCGVLRDHVPEAITFEIVRDRHYSNSSLYDLPGYFYYPYTWKSTLPQSPNGAK